jgi:hypothetical protein
MWNVVTIRGGYPTHEAAKVVAARHAAIEPRSVVRSYVSASSRGESHPWWLKDVPLPTVADDAPSVERRRGRD